ncbi:hypothetical protein AB5I41_01490 [Sphingomonas sp. MMS24-JH45]
MLDNVRAARCRYGYRLWAQGRATNVYADSNRNANVYIKPGTDYTIHRLYVTGDVPKQGDVYQDGKGAASLRIGWCNRPVVVSASAKNSVTLGEGCR